MRLRTRAKYGLFTGVVLLATLLGYRFWKPGTTTTAEVSVTAPEIADRSQPIPGPSSLDEPIEMPEATPEASSGPTNVETLTRSTTTKPLTQHAEATPEMRALVAALTQFPAGGGAITAEQAAQWKQVFQQLIQQGDSAIPAIREFLEENRDVKFGGSSLGYSSLRTAFLDALQQIGGAESQALMLQVLQTTSVPSEIARLASYLEKQAPGQFRDQIGSAARETLAQAANGQLRGWDVGPLFQVLQSYSDGSIASELERAASKWSYYSALTLANLPSGEGIASLVRLAQESASTGMRGVAVEALAQVAVQYPSATVALVELAKSGKIYERNWIIAASALGGERYCIRDTGLDNPSVASISGVRTYHLEASNQNYYSAPAWGGMSNEQISQRVAIIDQLLAVFPGGAVSRALETARTSLLANAQQASTN